MAEAIPAIAAVAAASAATAVPVLVLMPNPLWSTASYGAKASEAWARRSGECRRTSSIGSFGTGHAGRAGLQ
jgi:hypothetical protein